MSEFEIGEVVALRSGGSPMTVLGEDDGGLVHVGWHTTSGRWEEAFLRTDCLNGCKQQLWPVGQ